MAIKTVCARIISTVFGLKFTLQEYYNSLCDFMCGWNHTT